MAVTANSTPVPSRRAFFGSAIAAGAVVAQIPTLPAIADAAILAFAPAVEALIARSNGLERDRLAAEELINEMTGPPPKEPRDAAFFPCFADYQAAMTRHRAAMEMRGTQMAEVETRTGFAALEASCDTAYADLVEAREQLVGMRPTTLEGMIAKARVAGLTEWADLDRSIIADLLAMDAAA